MDFELILDTEDKSSYADKLSEWTGRPRTAWGSLSLKELKAIYARKLVEKKRSEHKLFAQVAAGTKALA